MSFDQGFGQDPLVDDDPTAGSVAVMSRASSIASHYSIQGALNTHASDSNTNSILNMNLIGNQHSLTDIDGNNECHLNRQQQHLTTDDGKSNNDNLMQDTTATATAATSAPADDTTSTMEGMIKEQTVSITSEANDEFQSLLYKLKKSVEAMSSEMSNYMSVAEGVEIDYMRVQDSLMKEKKRLNEVAPDIDGTTSSFVNF